jgi:hypothetical protein
MTTPVIAGPDPAIHRGKRLVDFLMDAQVKRAHDCLRTGRPS